MVVIFNKPVGKDSAFALSKDINLEVNIYINRYTEYIVALAD